MRLNNNDLQAFDELPEGWMVTTLGEILPLTYGKALRKDIRDESGSVAVYGSSGQVGVHSVALTEKPALVVGRKGSVGEVYRSSAPCWPIDTVYFSEERDDIDLKYFEYLLKGLKLAKLDKSTAVPGLSRDDYNAVEVAISPLTQQKRIVAEIEKQFSRLDEAVANLKRVKANLKRYKAAVLKAAVEGKLTEEWRAAQGRANVAGGQEPGATKAHPDVEPASKLLDRIFAERRAKWEQAELAKMEGKGKAPKNDKWKAKYNEPAPPDASQQPELPPGWVWVSFDQVTERVTKGSSPNWQGFEYSEEGIPFVRSQNVGWGVTDLSDVAFLPQEFNEKEKKSILREGDLLLNIVGASIGRAAIAPSAVQGGNVNQAVAVIRLLESGVSKEFMLLYLLSTQAQRRIHAEKVDVARANFSLEDVREMPLALPPRSEQDRIATEVDRHLSLVRETETQVDINLKRAERLRQSILSRAFSGQLVANGAEQVAAAAG